MNRVTLIAKMAEKSGLNKKQAELALTAFIDSVTEALKEGDKVQLMAARALHADAAAQRAHRPQSFYGRNHRDSCQQDSGVQARKSFARGVLIHLFAVGRLLVKAPSLV